MDSSSTAFSNNTGVKGSAHSDRSAEMVRATTEDRAQFPDRDWHDETHEQFLDRKWHEMGHHSFTFEDFQANMQEEYNYIVTFDYDAHIEWRTDNHQHKGKEDYVQFRNRKQSRNARIMHTLGLQQKEPDAARNKENVPLATGQDSKNPDGRHHNSDGGAPPACGGSARSPQALNQSSVAAIENQILRAKLRAANANNKHYEKQLQSVDESSKQAAATAALTLQAKAVSKKRTAPHSKASVKKSKVRGFVSAIPSSIE